MSHVEKDHEPVERADDETRSAQHTEHTTHERERKPAAGEPEDRLQRTEEHADDEPWRTAERLRLVLAVVRLLLKREILTIAHRAGKAVGSQPEVEQLVHDQHCECERVETEVDCLIREADVEGTAKETFSQRKREDAAREGGRTHGRKG